MKKMVMPLIAMMAFVSAVSAAEGESYQEPLKETTLLRIDVGNKIFNDDIQRMFTALTASYLKNNTSYLLAYEVFRESEQQALKPSIIITELDYGTFTIINIRYSFSNGYFEFKLSKSPFTNIVNNESVNSVDYGGVIDENLYKTINDKLQESVYIARGYAKLHGTTSSASFYMFRLE